MTYMVTFVYKLYKNRVFFEDVDAAESFAEYLQRNINITSVSITII